MAKPMKRTDLANAPRDSTPVWLLVDYTGEDAAHPWDDAKEAWTVGWNNFDYDERDEWTFSGWCWSHDHFTQGRGEIVGWAALEFPE